MSEVAQLPVRLQSGAKVVGIVPTTIEEVFRLASAVSKSGLAPRGMDTPEKLTVAIMHGLEIGLQPMQAIQKIAVVNGRPTVWGDAVPALLQSRGFKLREWIDEQGVAHCEVTRPDGHNTEREFSEADARKAGLWGKAGPWTQYPRRMLQMRARGFAARDGASDALSGLYIAEELQDAPEMKDITPTGPSAYAAKKDGFGEIANQIIHGIRACETIEVLDHLIAAHEDDQAQMPKQWRELIQAEYETRAEQIKAA